MAARTLKGQMRGVLRGLRSRAQATRLGRWADRLLDGHPAAEPPVMMGLVVLTAALTAIAIVDSRWLSPTALVLPIIAGGFLISLRLQVLVLVTVALGVVAEAQLRAPGTLGVQPGTVIVLVLTAVLVLPASRLRETLGLRGTRGDEMLLELSRNTRNLARLPVLGGDWDLDSALVSATGRRLSGDFIIAGMEPGRPRLRIGLVDVSGKGSRAAGRALHLSGAFSALLNTLPTEAFLAAANNYVVGLNWPDQFATAALVAVDAETGRYQMFNAGHPPPCHYVAAESRWCVLEHSDLMLGIVPGATYDAVHGHLAPGDGLLLYTDGLVEVPGESLEEGIGRMLVAAEPFMRAARPQPALSLVEAVARRTPDDRAVVLVRRHAA